MSQFLVIHPDNPQLRLIRLAAKVILDGGILVYPTDSAYALGCRLENKSGFDRICQIRQIEEDHPFTLICQDLSQISTYATIDNTAFRVLKSHTPGAYTFILSATKEVPKRLLQPKRLTIGLRIPESAILQALLNELQEPMMSVSLILPHHEAPFEDAKEIHDLLGNQVDAVIDGGPCGLTPTTVIDLVDGEQRVVRVGKGVV